MKTIKTFLITSVVFFNTCSSQERKDYSEEHIKFVKEFYFEYHVKNYNNFNFKTFEIVLRKYCSKNLATYIIYNTFPFPSEEETWDFFANALRPLNNILDFHEIKRDITKKYKKGSYFYKFCHCPTEKGKPICIDLEIINTEEGFKFISVADAEGNYKIDNNGLSIPLEKLVSYIKKKHNLE